MLPDYPKLKEDLAARFLDFIKRRMDHHLGPLRDVPHVRLFEGSGRRLTRASGETEPGDMKEISAEWTVAREELPSMTLDGMLVKLDSAAQEMARQMSGHTYETISKAAEKIGNVVDSKGRGLSATTILEALSSIQIEFKPDGTARMPEIHIPPNLSEAAKLASAELDRDPTLTTQFKEIMEEKRGEWRAREASRKLVG